MSKNKRENRHIWFTKLPKCNGLETKTEFTPRTLVMQETWSDHLSTKEQKKEETLSSFRSNYFPCLDWSLMWTYGLKSQVSPHHSESISQDLDVAVFITFQQIRMLTRRAFRTSLMHVFTIWRSNRFHFAIYVPVDYGGN